MPFPLILSEIPAIPPTAEVSLHPTARVAGVDEADKSHLLQGAPAASQLLRSGEIEVSAQPGQIPWVSSASASLTLNPEVMEFSSLQPAVEHSGEAAVRSIAPNSGPVGNKDASQRLAQTAAGGNDLSRWQDGSFPATAEAGLDDGAAGAPTASPGPSAPLRLQADRQEFDQTEQIISAYGNVSIQFGDAELSSNRLWVNLINRFVRAEEDVLFTRNQQIIAGSSATYNLIQGAGTILDAQGELDLNRVDEDFSPDLLLADPASQAIQPIDERIRAAGSISSVTSPGALIFGTDSRNATPGEANTINRLRFAADRVDFDATGWFASGVRLTNDPFSPPEIEFRGDTARLTPLNAEEDELVITNARVVFDQGLSIPLLRDRIILRRGQVDPDQLSPIPTAIGIDGRDRGGLYIERPFPVNIGGPWQVTLVPQFYVQRWLSESGANIGDPANFGLVGTLDGVLGPRTSVTAVANLSGFDLANFNNRLRASVRGRQLIGDHTLNLEYSYRDRLFNGSLGFQDVQSSLGAVLLSPVIRLGDTQIDLTYQLSGQYVTAATDRPDLIGANNPSNLTSLLRFQGSVALGRGFLLWRGEGLPPTQTEGLRYSPRPVVPFLQLAAGLRGIGTYYSSSDFQETITADVRLEGQFGHFSRPYLDFTQFNIGYSKSFVGGATSPFLFDRNVDQNVLSGGLLQQIYGPFRAGFQTALNLDTGRFIETELVFEYSRRAYGLVVRYNPAQASGFIGFRLSDFAWIGRAPEFDQAAPD